MSFLTNQQQQLTLVQALVNGVLQNLTVHLFSNSIQVSPATLLTDFVECTFPGYAAVPNQSPGVAYIAPDQNIHATFPALTFLATNGATQQMVTELIGPITMAGNITAIVTAVGMTGTPRTVTIPVLTTDSDAELAVKVMDALNLDADTGPFFLTTTSGRSLFLTRTAAAANDATMNVALANGTAVGLTAKPTATQLRAGLAPGVGVNDACYGYYLTDLAGTTLKGCQNIQQVTFSQVGDGFVLTPDYIYGG